jgi:hypothetical protein
MSIAARDSKAGETVSNALGSSQNKGPNITI